MPSIRDLRRHLSAAGIDHSEAKNRAALETLCIEHGLAERVEVRPSGPPCARCRKPLVGEFLAIGASRFQGGEPEEERWERGKARGSEEGRVQSRKHT